MAFFKEALNERGIGGRGKGGNSAWIKRRSFRSRSICSGVNFPDRKTRFQTFLAILLSPFSLPFAFRDFVGGGDTHGVLGSLLINDDDITAVGRITPYCRESGCFTGSLIGRVL